jgi:hypothetical protein
MIHSADPCRHPTVHSRKLGDTASHSSLSPCGLALLTVAHQALTVAKLPLYILLLALLCKLKLSLRCVLSGCTLTSRPLCTLGGPIGRAE